MSHPDPNALRLHDWTLVRIAVEQGGRNGPRDLQSPSGPRCLYAAGLQDLRVPQTTSWGQASRSTPFEARWANRARTRRPSPSKCSRAMSSRSPRAPSTSPRGEKAGLNLPGQPFFLQPHTVCDGNWV